MINKELYPLRPILLKMCKMVGANVNAIDFREERWFMKYSWTEAQQEEFLDWLTCYLRRTDHLDRVMRILQTRRSIRRTAEGFVFNYGWVCREG